MATRPTAPKRHKPITANFLQQLASGVVGGVSGAGARASNQNGDIVVEVDTLQRIPVFRLMLVTAIQDRYLTCQRLRRGLAVPADVSVLRPYELQHDAAQFPAVTTITTTNAQEVIATDGVSSETWKVTPDYVAGTTRIIAMQLYTGETDNASELIKWVDKNWAGRAWAVL